MPPQIPPDQFYPEQAHSNEARIGNAQTLPVNRQGPAPEPPRPPMSRRSVLRGVAGVGAVGAAAAAGAGAVVAFDRQSGGQPTLMPVSKPVVMAPMAPTAMAGPLVVYIADTTSGLLDVFGGTGATQVRNPALVRQLLANLKLA
jgi:hypothetical protein